MEVVSLLTVAKPVLKGVQITLTVAESERLFELLRRHEGVSRGGQGQPMLDFTIIVGDNNNPLYPVLASKMHGDGI